MKLNFMEEDFLGMDRNVQHFIEENLDIAKVHDWKTFFKTWALEYGSHLNTQQDNECLDQIFQILKVLNVNRQETLQARIDIVTETMDRVIHDLMNIVGARVIKIETVKSLMSSFLWIDNDLLLGIFSTICKKSKLQQLDKKGEAFKV